jgi:hypothetical protein
VHTENSIQAVSSNVTHCYFAVAFLTQAQVPFPHVVDFKGIRRGWDLRGLRILCNGLLVDMDGVLVDSTPAVARVRSRWALKHNMDPEYVVHFAHGRMCLDSLWDLLPHADPVPLHRSPRVSSLRSFRLH